MPLQRQMVKGRQSSHLSSRWATNSPASARQYRYVLASCHSGWEDRACTHHPEVSMARNQARLIEMLTDAPESSPNLHYFFTNSIFYSPSVSAILASLNMLVYIMCTSELASELYGSTYISPKVLMYFLKVRLLYGYLFACQASRHSLARGHRERLRDLHGLSWCINPGQ